MEKCHFCGWERHGQPRRFHGYEINGLIYTVCDQCEERFMEEAVAARIKATIASKTTAAERLKMIVSTEEAKEQGLVLVRTKDVAGLLELVELIDDPNCMGILCEACGKTSFVHECVWNKQIALEEEVGKLRLAIQFVAMLTNQDGSPMNGLGFKFKKDGTFRCTAMVDGPGPEEGHGKTEWEALVKVMGEFWDVDKNWRKTFGSEDDEEHGGEADRQADEAGEQAHGSGRDDPDAGELGRGDGGQGGRA